MSNESHRAELAELRGIVEAGFARMDRYFEKQLGLSIELRGETRGLRGGIQELHAEMRELTRRLDRIEQQLPYLRYDVSVLRDATQELADIRWELLKLRREVIGRRPSLRAEVDALTERVTRIERDWDMK